MESKVKPCTCNSTYQDEKYGKGNRVHNFCRLNPKPAGKGWRCTVCGERKNS